MLGFYDLSAFPLIGSPVWPIAALALLFVLGQTVTILAFSLGEVSIVAPVMGLKVILVNIILAAGLREGLSGRIWLASILAVLGIFILQSNPRKQWTPTLGFERFLPPAMLLAGLFSLLFFLPPGPSSKRPPRAAFKFLLPGALLLALQSLLLIYAIAIYGKVAEANILYSSRGVWSVLAVWWLGHRFANSELQHHDSSRLHRRLFGATLITAAIILTLLGSP